MRKINRRRCSLFGMCCALGGLLWAAFAPAAAAVPGAPAVEKHRGVNWVAGRQIEEEDLRELAARHINWIVQTPFGWQRRYNEPALAMATSGRVLWGESDEGVETTAALAHKYGIKTMLKPHIWLRGGDGTWRSDIAMESEADWRRWFAAYREFIVHYARLAERCGIEALCIGTELHATVKQKPGEWRRIIREVRAAYRGQLTYAANWYDEYCDVSFWDELDFIGIQAYFPLTQNVNPSVDELVKGWAPHLKAVAELQQRYNKPVIFTEIGYRTSADAAIEPWKWPSRGESFATAQDLATQANCYEAFFRSCWHQPWFAGAYFWKWYPRMGQRHFRREQDFTPQSKAAEQVMVRWYTLDAGGAGQ